MIISAEYSDDKIESSKPSLITISPDGKLVALSQDKRVNLYTVMTGKLVACIEEPHSQPIVKVLKAVKIIHFHLIYCRFSSPRTVSTFSLLATNTLEYSSMFLASKTIFTNLKKC